MSVEQEIKNIEPHELEWPPNDVRNRMHLRIKAMKYSMPKIESSGIAGAKKSVAELNSVGANLIAAKTGDDKLVAAGKALARTAQDITTATINAGYGVVEKALDYADEKLLTKAFVPGEPVFTAKLYIPGAFNDTQGAGYSEYVTDMEKSLVKNIINSDLGGATIMGKKISSIGGLLGDNENLQQLAMWKTGRALAPAETMIFKTISRTSFSLTWKMIPHSRKEAIMMLAIVVAFKRGVKPSIDLKSPFFKYPPMYSVTFCPANSDVPVESGQFKNYRYMALNNVGVNYGNDNDIMTWYDNEIPTSIELTLGFESMMVPYNLEVSGEDYRSWMDAD